MAKHNDDMFKKVVTDGLQKQFQNGLAQGSYAMCQVVLEKARDEGKSYEERLKDIIRFCSVCTKPN